jgi:histidine kinase
MRKPGIRFKLVASLWAIVLLPLLLTPLAAFGYSTETGVFHQADQSVLIIVFLVSLPLFVCTLHLARTIKESILQPLQELTSAAEQIVEGNLDTPIRYRANDEMGKFSAVFELMRTRLLESTEQQKKAEQARNDLIASISHDLRTPLTSIRGYVEGLQDGIGRDKDKFDRYLTVIRDKTNKLDERIEDLFRFSQLESGQLPMSLEPWDTGELLETLIQPLEKEMAEGERRLTVLRPFPQASIRADASRLAQVFDNLIDNALKYAGKGAVITIGAERGDDGLTVKVHDNGTAIAAEQRPYLFDRFYRGDKSRSGEVGGSGLGLAICKHIIEAHSGKIGVGAGGEAGMDSGVIPGGGTDTDFDGEASGATDVESGTQAVPAKGNTFFFTLPLAADCSKPPSNRKAGDGHQQYNFIGR